MLARVNEPSSINLSQGAMDNNDAVSALRGDAIRALTALARHTSTNGAQLDFADVMASILASTAANVGGIDYLLTGRCGSWEAGLVESLITGTVPEEELLRYRTDPIAVPLHVAELVEVQCQQGGYAEALDRLYEEHQDDEDATELDHREAELYQRFATMFRDYAESFERSLTAAGAALSVPFEIGLNADVDPTSEWWREGTPCNPSEYGDPVVWRLWSHAFDACGVPAVESITSQYAP